jgi:hypothetical protein
MGAVAVHEEQLEGFAAKQLEERGNGTHVGRTEPPQQAVTSRKLEEDDGL